MESTNILQCVRSVQVHHKHIGDSINWGLYGVKKNLQHQFVNECSKWRVFKTASHFNRRVTVIEWHPVHPHVVAFGSHGGDIYLCNYTQNGKDSFIEGEGIGHGSITQLVFSPENPTYIYTSSINGTVCMKDFEYLQSEVFIDTMDFRYWWTSLSYCQSKRLLFVGGNTGNALLLDPIGTKLQEYKKFHKDKIHYAEFCPADNNLLVTTSNDRTVAMWDIRYVRNCNDDERPRPLSVMKHEGPVTCATFDPIYGSRLLTTAQNNEIRIYNPYNWIEPSIIIKHSHRHFQHMTDIKATWHPFYEDLCLIGRYAEIVDLDKTRCVDVIDLQKGSVVAQFYDPLFSQIMVLNKFNKWGDTLATGMGYTGLLWKLPSLDISNTKLKYAKGCIPLPLSQQNGQQRKRGRDENERQKKIKRNKKDETDTKNKLVIACTTRNKKPKK